MKNTLIILFLFCLFSACAKKEEPLKILLLAGQSNMEGAGNYDELSSAEMEAFKVISKKVKLCSNSTAVAPLSYYEMPQKSKKYGFPRFFGPEFFIAKILNQKYPEQEFLFIKHSKGGTSLYGAWSPDWTPEKAQAVERKGEKQERRFYHEHIANIKHLTDSLAKAERDYEIIGIVWMQGENDAAKEVSAVTYGDNLRHLIAAYRRDVKVENLPFVFGQINSTYGRFKSGPAVVRKSMEKVAEKDAFCSMIPTSTDTSWSDYPKHEGVHYNTEGQRRLGTAMANALMAYLE